MLIMRVTFCFFELLMGLPGGSVTTIRHNTQSNTPAQTRHKAAQTIKGTLHKMNTMKKKKKKVKLSP
jgi:hypothetical protein